MKKFLLLALAVLVSAAVFAQPCSKPFISKYVEGYSNNRAIEVYNPTSAAIDLSNYAVGRFSNGSTSFQAQQLPAVMLQPYDTYLAVLDKRDSLGTCFEIPVWNGYQKWDVCLDGTTGLPIIDADGDTVYCVQYQPVTCSGGDIPHHMYGTDYNDFLDLEGRADGFFDPTYDNNNPMYFNGNDAVALIEGTAVSPDGSNILDVVGVVGEDPAGGAWTMPNGSWITRDRTIVKRSSVKEGRLVVKGVAPDTLVYSEWDIYPKNTFYVIDGGHDCECDPTFVSTRQINTVDFNIYPNPASANRAIMIEAEAPINSVAFSNLLGQTVQTTAFDGSQPRLEVQVPDLATGIYLVTIRFKDNSITTRKLSVQ